MEKKVRCWCGSFIGNWLIGAFVKRLNVGTGVRPGNAQSGYARVDRIAHSRSRIRAAFNVDPNLADKAAFKAYLAPLQRTKWFVYSKRPFAGPEQVLAYLSRYTHRVAISNSRLIAADATSVTFRYKDYRIKGPGRYKTMTLEPGEFPSRWGCCHPHPSQFRTCRFPASGSSRASFAHVGVAMDNPSSRQWIPF